MWLYLLVRYCKTIEDYSDCCSISFSISVMLLLYVPFFYWSRGRMIIFSAAGHAIFTLCERKRDKRYKERERERTKNKKEEKREREKRDLKRERENEKKENERYIERETPSCDINF